MAALREQITDYYHVQQFSGNSSATCRIEPQSPTPFSRGPPSPYRWSVGLSLRSFQGELRLAACIPHHASVAKLRKCFHPANLFPLLHALLELKRKACPLPDPK
ncbi:hypothetical protein EJ05DRAFT_282545 [Pseudovirgaria hyperparasitica]|uniref:Uncharacterized protein n=1 Tax=Pseudovirgaria hyperparasitica TaxID=470096 RepID=A0A6A6WEQ2_9PEZI|nr:uncharacterized protein EJ05DRAFT_282545 [Pseudovirgaria hyperparasitica]KAF2760366.1 hypothetical protein EJ05DRAFT_282545 [Pseudovirgaria hyperparasitica]